MNADLVPTAQAKGPGFLRSRLASYQNETAQSLALWALIALLNFGAQIVFRRDMRPGEFGTLNTALGIIGLMTVPVLALHQAFAHYLARVHPDEESGRVDSLRTARLLIIETFAWIWGAISIPLLLLVLPLLGLPRFSLQLFTLLDVLLALGGLVSCAVCQEGNQVRRWAWLLAGSAVTRVVAGAGLAWAGPWAEAGLGAFLLAGFITLAPALRERAADLAGRLRACARILDADFFLCLSATFSVVLALFLFSSADRIVAQGWFGVATNNNIGLVNWDQFDAYQTAGLLGRSLLWGTQPLLWILFAQRSRLARTSLASLNFFWIYAGALLLGAILLTLLAQPLSQLFCGAHYLSTSYLVAIFALAMLPLGLLQGLGIFALASRRYPECFVLGICSVGYTILLDLAGRQPELMPAYMFGGGLVSLMVVLFVGVVRWGRRQP